MAKLKPGRHQGRDPITGRKMLDGITAIVSERTGEVTYQARWDWTDPAGRRKQKTATRKTLDEAEEAKLKGELQARQGPVVEPEKKTLNEFFEEWHERESLRWQPSTAYINRSIWRRIFRDSLGDIPVRKITKALCQAEVTRLAGMKRKKDPTHPLYKASTINLYMLMLKALLNAAVEDEIITANPARRIVLPRESDQRKETWTAATTAAFLEKTSESDCSLLWWYLATTGARIGEALSLRWSDIDLDQGCVTFRATIQRQADGSWGTKAGTKMSDAPAIIPLVPSVVARFAAAQKAARSGPVVALNPLVFQSKPDKGLTPYQAQYRLRRDCRLAGLPEISPHVFRHTAGTLLVSMGVPESMVKEILRHKSIVTTLGTYVHPSQDDLRKALAKLDGALSTTTSGPESAQSRESV